VFASALEIYIQVGCSSDLAPPPLTRPKGELHFYNLLMVFKLRRGGGISSIYEKFLGVVVVVE
jgi:hypothetical protein